VTRLVRPHGGTVFMGQLQAKADEAAISADDLGRWTNGESNWQIIERDGVWSKYVRPPLTGAGQWTHFFAEPGNTACSGDTLVRGPFLLQWFGEPGPRDMIDRHHRTVSPLCADGRLFIPGNQRVFAVDAYTGTPMWSHEVSGFRRIAALRDTGNMAVANDRLYVAAGRNCHVFAGESGEKIAAYEPPNGMDGSPRDWGYVAIVDKCLFGSATRPDASRTDHSRAAIGGAYYDGRPIVTSTSVFCRNSEMGEMSWTYRATHGAILNPTICLGGGRLYFVESTNPATLAEKAGRSTLANLLASGSQIVALDVANGQEIWRQEANFKAIAHSLYLCYADERLVAVGSRNQQAEGGSQTNVWYDIHTIGAADGRPLWRQSQDNRQRAGGSHGEQDHHPTIVGNTIYAQPLAYDLATGQRNESWKLSRGGHGCGTLSACQSSLFFRAGNPCTFDLANNRKSKLTQVTRPGCWINIIPAGGLVLIPEASSGCTCKFSIQTSLALVPAALETMAREE
jgi:outer membrane protein assembly factor BamB